EGTNGVAEPARPVAGEAGGAVSPLASSLLGLVASAVAVVLAGVALARSSDVIAARTELGRVWVGSVFLAMATSLPELVTDISAMRLGAADLAAGDLFGSGMANMLILAVIALRPGAQLFHRAALDHTLSAALAIVMTGIAAIAIMLGPQTAVLRFGPGSLLLLVTYVLGTRLLFRHSAVVREAGVTMELSGAQEGMSVEGGARALPSLRAAVVRFLAATVVIIVAAPVFASSAVRIAELTGIATSFVGTLLVGVTTSLPELVTSIAAMRMGAVDLAIGNLLGSNAVNMVIFVPLDFAAGGVPLLGMVRSEERRV